MFGANLRILEFRLIKIRVISVIEVSNPVVLIINIETKKD